jgi:cell division protein ZapA (FtsZ GTPase activity inhibitor)
VDSGNPDKTLVRVTIFQQPYTLRSSGEPGETEILAQAVDSLMNQIAARTSGTDPTRVAVLAALHLADRARQLERRLDNVRAAVEQAAERIDLLINGSPE